MRRRQDQYPALHCRKRDLPYGFPMPCQILVSASQRTADARQEHCCRQNPIWRCTGRGHLCIHSQDHDVNSYSAFHLRSLFCYGLRHQSEQALDFLPMQASSSTRRDGPLPMSAARPPIQRLWEHCPACRLPEILPCCRWMYLQRVRADDDKNLPQFLRKEDCADPASLGAVSYTHLTLPTIYSV